MIDIKKLKVDDVLINKVSKDKKCVKYITPNYIIAEDCKNGKPVIIIKYCYGLYTKRNKYIWTDWEECMLYFNDPFDRYDDCIMKIKCEVRSNGKRVQVRSGALSAIASCNEECGDEFDFDKGLELAGKRLILKWLSHRLEAEAKG